MAKATISTESYHLRIPIKLLRLVQKIADKNRRTLSQQVLVYIENGVARESNEQAT